MLGLYELAKCLMLVAFPEAARFEKCCSITFPYCLLMCHVYNCTQVLAVATNRTNCFIFVLMLMLAISHAK